MKRIQVSWRHKGGKKPNDTVYVGRPTKWGNPYSVSEYGRETCLKLFEQDLSDRLVTEPSFLEPLKEKDLACWCKPQEACHADILLRYANKEATTI